MKAGFKVDKNALGKVARQIEKEINRQIKIGECGMSKDAISLLEFIVNEAKELNVTAIEFNIKEVKDIPNIKFGITRLLDELKICGMLNEYIMTLGGNVSVYLTTDGMEYFDEGEKMGMENKNGMTFNINGGQVNIAKDESIINAVQNNGVAGTELENIVKSIRDNLSELKIDAADEIVDVVDMAKEELSKPEPRVSRLRNCVTLIAPLLTVVNGTPVLVENLQKLHDMIMLYIK